MGMPTDEEFTSSEERMRQVKAEILEEIEGHLSDASGFAYLVARVDREGTKLYTFATGIISDDLFPFMVKAAEYCAIEHEQEITDRPPEETFVQ